MDSAESELAFLYLSDDPSEWETEKAALVKEISYTVVVDVQKMTEEVSK